MKNIIFVFAVGFLVHNVFSIDDILSKFRQNGYKIKDFRIQLMNYDKDFYNFFEIKAFKFNRTTTAHNGSMNTKYNAKDDVEVLVQVYKFLSNEYRHFPIRFQVNLKKSVDSNAIGLGQIKKCGNLTDFYFYKDVTYFVCNFVIDETRFPPLIPNGKYKIEVTLLYFDKEVAMLHMFCEIHTPIPYPNK